MKAEANLEDLKLLDAKAAAELLGVSASTLAVWRCVKRYPLPFVKVGSGVKYRLSDLRRFIESRTVRLGA